MSIIFTNKRTATSNLRKLIPAANTMYDKICQAIAANKEYFKQPQYAFEDIENNAPGTEDELANLDNVIAEADLSDQVGPLTNNPDKAPNVVLAEQAARLDNTTNSRDIINDEAAAVSAISSARNANVVNPRAAGSIVDSSGNSTRPSLESIADNIYSVRNIQMPGKLDFSRTSPVVYSNGFSPRANRENRNYSIEAFSPTSISNNQANIAANFAYNFLAGLHDEVTQLFYPLIPVPIDSSGPTLRATVDIIMNRYKHSMDGTFKPWITKTLLYAVTDSDSMKEDITEMVPVYRDTGAGMLTNDFFVAPAKYAIEDRVLTNGEAIKTSFLTVDKLEGDLISLASRNSEYDQTDTIDPGIRIGQLLIEFPNLDGGQILVVDTARLPEASFLPQPQYEQTRRYAILEISGRGINAATKFYDIATKGSTKDLAGGALVSNTNWSAFIDIRFQVSIDLEKGQYQLGGAGNVQLRTIINDKQERVELTDPAAANFVSDFADAKILGWRPIAHFENRNHRFLGRILEKRVFMQNYIVPLLSPLSSLGTTQDSQASDGERIEMIANANRIRIETATIEALAENFNYLKTTAIEKNRSDVEKSFNLGIGRYFVQTHCEEIVVDVAALIQNLETRNKGENIRSLIAHQLQQVIFRVIERSGYSIALKSLMNDPSAKPCFAMACYNEFRNHLGAIGGIDGILGSEVDFKVVGSPNTALYEEVTNAGGKKRVKYITYIAPVIPGIGPESPANPLHHGNLYQKPSFVTAANMVRDSEVLAREFSVHPSWIHVMNCPVMIKMVFDNVDTVLLSNAHYKIVNVP